MNYSPQTLSARIHDFFEKPSGFAARSVQVLIFLLIIASLINLVIEFRYVELFERHKLFFYYQEHLILAVFTAEYVLRLATANHKLRFALKPMNVVDFFAVFPSYIEFLLPVFINISSVRALRLIRMLRFARILRVFKLFRYGKLFGKILRYEGTILQSITPIIGMFVFLKAVIWILEANGLWILDPNLGELFAIIGFALGIILSQKIGVTYDKFLRIDETTISLQATLRSLAHVLDDVEPEKGSRECRAWARVFLRLLKDPEADNGAIHAANTKLYLAMASAEPVPGEIAMLHGQICRDAEFCLAKKVRVTPKAYDTLLHQATMLYFTLIAVFLPGLAGMVSVIVGTYTLYGMYNLTEDLDSILGGDFNLINIDISDLEKFVESTVSPPPTLS